MPSSIAAFGGSWVTSVNLGAGLGPVPITPYLENVL